MCIAVMGWQKQGYIWLLKNITKKFIKNSYPPTLIKDKIEFIKKRNFTPNSNKTEYSKEIKQKPDCFHTFKLTYSNFNIDYISRKIQKIIKNITPDFKVSFVYRSPKLSQIVLKHLKPKLDKYDQCAVVYQFDCPCGLSYIGETARPLLKRVQEHNQRSRSTAIYNHTSTCTIYQNSLPNCTTKKNSTFLFHFKQYFHILASNLYNYTKRINTEAIYISLLAPKLNEQSDFKRMKIFWHINRDFL